MRLLLVLLLIFPPVALADVNAGFVQGLWYSQNQIFVGDTVRVYVAVRNNSDADLTGRVDFFANGERFGRDAITVLEGRLVEAWADWTPAYGEHVISANLSRLELYAVGGTNETATVTSALAEDIVFVDYDTDGDGIGNRDDEDDDNDGVSDEAEAAAGTDPLVADVTAVTEREEKQAEDDEAAEASASAASSSSPVGLEQFLTDNRARDGLATFTNFVNTTRENLDTYRTTREERLAGATDTAEAPEANTPKTTETPDESESTAENAESPEATTSVGTITRTQGNAPHESWLDFAFGKATSLWVVSYTFILSILSGILAHPMWLQIAFLLLLLFLFLKLAKRVAGRPN